MKLNQLNQKLLRTLGLIYVGFLILGILLNLLFPLPSIVILIDRSYCPPNQWIQITKNYEKIYQQHQQKSLKIKEVILFSNLGQEVLSSPPSPEQIRTINTYGRPDLQRLQQLQNSYPKAKLLQCQ